MKANKKRIRERETVVRDSAFKSLVIDLNDQLQTYLNALKTASGEDGTN